MLVEIPYQREKAVRYAQRWALKRNPAFLNFEGMGGDCTNFASQCLFAGSGVMNYSPVYGWYYISAGKRSASWSGVTFLYNFLLKNTGAGPYATETNRISMEPGDLLQLGDETGNFYHTPVVAAVSPDEIYVAAHTFDAWMRPLSSYSYEKIRFLHIQGARKYQRQ
ncbi:MAG: amidase domain-containing protein [Clostridiales bacterium]|nr:amidase domain-containing protein [Clostridiales bacterium]